MYEVLLFVHLMTAIVWLGGSVALHVIAVRLPREGRGVVLPQLAFYGDKIIGPAAGVLLLAGLGLVAEIGYSITEPFVLIGLAGWLASGYIGFALIGRTGERIETEMKEAPGDPAGIDVLYGKLLTWSRIDLAIVTLVVLAMVVRPGT